MSEPMSLDVAAPDERSPSPWSEAGTSESGRIVTSEDCASLQALVDEIEDEHESCLPEKPPADVFCNARHIVQALDEDVRADVTGPLAAQAHLARLRESLETCDCDLPESDALRRQITEHPLSAVDAAELRWPLRPSDIETAPQWSLADEVQAIIDRERSKRQKRKGKRGNTLHESSYADTAVTLSAAATSHATLLSLFDALGRRHAQSQSDDMIEHLHLSWRNVLLLIEDADSDTYVPVPPPVLASARQRMQAIFLCQQE